MLGVVEAAEVLILGQDLEEDPTDLLDALIERVLRLEVMLVNLGKKRVLTLQLLLVAKNVLVELETPVQALKNALEGMPAVDALVVEENLSLQEKKDLVVPDVAPTNFIYSKH